MSDKVMFRLTVPHVEQEEGNTCGGWITCGFVARDSLGRVNPRHDSSTPRGWLLLGCNSTGCPARAVLRIAEAVDFIWRNNKPADDVAQYLSLSYVPEEDMDRYYHDWMRRKADQEAYR